MPKKAIALLSGGLDSTLAISEVLEQGIEVLALTFVGPFCTCTPRKTTGCNLASQVAIELGVELRTIHKGMDYLRMVENPRFGRGRGLNPCISCRIFMLRKAAELMAEAGASFVITGEVVGQRPSSQNRASLKLIEHESGLAGRLLRPLSAHLLDPTLPEIEGIVDRKRLLGIQGRSRSIQLAIRRKKKIRVTGCSAGGCLLTDPIIARRMRDIFDHCPDWNLTDAKLTTIGRHFRLHERLKAILGRNRIENERLISWAGILPRAEFTSEPGPTAILRGRYDNEDLRILGRLMRFFAKKAIAPEIEIQLIDGDSQSTWFSEERANREEVARWSI